MVLYLGFFSSIHPNLYLYLPINPPAFYVVTSALNLPAYFDQIIDPDSEKEALVNELWNYQCTYNQVMAKYAAELAIQGPASIPISFFKSFDLKDGDWSPEVIFESSGTTGQIPSRHLVKDTDWYNKISLQGFHERFGREKYRILALLPSYLERGNSSLVFMMQHWIEQFGLPGSGFYLDNLDELVKHLQEAEKSGEKVLLMGVSFALLDLAERGDVKVPPGTLIIETGGMKGRRKELTRAELHATLRAGLGATEIHSEYGMTELLSQAYTIDGFRFRPSSSLLVRISDLHLDRLTVPIGRVGRIQLIDLANVHSCAFIATDDLGRMHPDGTFEVLGRIDNAELRGCNLMYVG